MVRCDSKMVSLANGDLLVLGGLTVDDLIAIRGYNDVFKSIDNGRTWVKNKIRNPWQSRRLLHIHYTHIICIYVCMYSNIYPLSSVFLFLWYIVIMYYY